MCAQWHIPGLVWQSKNRKVAGGLGVWEQKPREKFSNLHLESLGNTCKYPLN